jgi:FAD-dependent fumarate reductase
MKDSIELFINDTLRSGKKKSKEELVKTLVDNSFNAIKFLEDKGINADLLSQCGGHSAARTHRSKQKPNSKPMNFGLEVILTLLNYLKNKKEYIGRFNILTDSEVVEILYDEKKKFVNGVVYKKKNNTELIKLMGDSVILTTGGFAADRKDYLKKYVPNISHLGTTNSDHADGSGLGFFLIFFF